MCTRALSRKGSSTVSKKKNFVRAQEVVQGIRREVLDISRVFDGVYSRESSRLKISQLLQGETEIGQKSLLSEGPSIRKFPLEPSVKELEKYVSAGHRVMT